MLFNKWRQQLSFLQYEWTTNGYCVGTHVSLNVRVGVCLMVCAGLGWVCCERQNQVQRQEKWRQQSDRHVLVYSIFVPARHLSSQELNAGACTGNWNGAIGFHLQTAACMCCMRKVLKDWKQTMQLLQYSCPLLTAQILSVPDTHMNPNAASVHEKQKIVCRGQWTKANFSSALPLCWGVSGTMILTWTPQLHASWAESLAFSCIVESDEFGTHLQFPWADTASTLLFFLGKQLKPISIASPTIRSQNLHCHSWLMQLTINPWTVYLQPHSTFFRRIGWIYYSMINRKVSLFYQIFLEYLPSYSLSVYLMEWLYSVSMH